MMGWGWLKWDGCLICDGYMGQLLICDDLHGMGQVIWDGMGSIIAWVFSATQSNVILLPAYGAVCSSFSFASFRASQLG